MTSSFIVWSQLLDAMVEWLYALPEGNSHLVK
jgi:hypothetical protein